MNRRMVALLLLVVAAGGLAARRLHDTDESPMHVAGLCVMHNFGPNQPKATSPSAAVDAFGSLVPGKDIDASAWNPAEKDEASVTYDAESTDDAVLATGYTQLTVMRDGNDWQVVTGCT